VGVGGLTGNDTYSSLVKKWNCDYCATSTTYTTGFTDKGTNITFEVTSCSNEWCFAGHSKHNIHWCNRVIRFLTD
jgi:hypothetical protein